MIIKEATTDKIRVLLISQPNFGGRKTIYFVTWQNINRKEKIIPVVNDSELQTIRQATKRFVKLLTTKMNFS